MKASAILYVGLLFSILTVGIICVLTMKSSYAESIRTNLDDSIVYSVSLLQQDKGSVIYVDELGVETRIPKQNIEWGTELADDEITKFKADFISYLTARLDEKITDVEVHIYGVNTTAGALSVEVVAHFTYPTGQTDTVSSYKTVILNKYQK